jgi:uncharacterized protein (DUF849 family)
MQKLVIEVRVNEGAMRDQNPNVPWLPEEIARDGAACREAGAAILHFHTRTADGGPDFSYERYRETILAARAQSDMLIHATLGYEGREASGEERIANTVRLAQDPATRPDFAPVDMGSTNMDAWDPVGRRFVTRGLVYRNGTDTLEHLVRVLRECGVTPYLVSWNISFTRQIGAFLDAGLLGSPAYVLLTLTEGIALGGHPSTPEGLDAHTRFLPRGHRIEWTANTYDGDLLKLSEKIIRDGGHISIGLGDYPYVEYGCPTNAELVRRIVEQARSLGREVATPQEARAILKPDTANRH